MEEDRIGEQTDWGAEKETAQNLDLWRETDSGHEEQLQRYASLKRHQEIVAEHILRYYPPVVKQARNLLDCGTRLIYLDYYRRNEWRLRHGFTCKQHLLCACCAMRRHAVLAKTYEKRIRHLLEVNPSWVPVLITKTVKDGPDLSERFAHISKAHRSLVKWRNDALRANSLRLRNPSVMRHVYGGAGAYEFKRGSRSGLWHPHIHEIALLDADAFEFTEVERKGKRVSVPLEFESLLAKEWWQLTGDSYIVDVRRLYVEDLAEGKDDLFAGVCEAFKYALKMNTLTPDDQVQGYLALNGRRLVYNYGCLYGLKVPDDSSDTIEDELALEPYLVVFYKYFRGQYHLEDIRQPFDDEYRPFTKVEIKERKERKLKLQLYQEQLFSEKLAKSMEEKRKRRSCTRSLKSPA